jgi:hypothetical protein
MRKMKITLPDLILKLEHVGECGAGTIRNDKMRVFSDGRGIARERMIEGWEDFHWRSGKGVDFFFTTGVIRFVWSILFFKR